MAMTEYAVLKFEKIILYLRRNFLKDVVLTDIKKLMPFDEQISMEYPKIYVYNSLIIYLLYMLTKCKVY
ncbi:hypothetical protein ADMFC3_18450 [Geovibrio sp. ADMFC3]